MKAIFTFALVLLLSPFAGARPQAKAKPLSPGQIQGLVKGGVDSHRIAALVERRGINFEPTEDFLAAVRNAGGTEVLIEALRAARPVRPAAPKPAVPKAPTSPALAPQVIAQQHVNAARSFDQKQQWPEAEREYDAARELDPKNPQICVALAQVLSEEKKWNEAVTEYREALVLGPNDAQTEYKLGTLLYGQGNLPGAVGALAAAARLAPDSPDIEVKLGLARYVSGDLDGSIAAYREAIRLRPKDPETHNALGDALLKKGDRLAALEEYRQAFEQAPNKSTFQASYPQILQELRRSAAAKPAPQGPP